MKTTVNITKIEKLKKCCLINFFFIIINLQFNTRIELVELAIYLMRFK